MARRIAVLTTGRQDWGILRSTCALLRDDPTWDLRLLVGGMHLSERFGKTEFEVRADGFEANESMSWIDPAEEGDAAATGQAARALVAIGGALARQDPEALVLVGDRLETSAAALAATVARVPVVHLHGGEETAGAIDNALRHAITQLARLHLVSHEAHRARVVSMGVNPSCVRVVGAPGLDNLSRTDLPTREELSDRVGIALMSPIVVVTLHPATASSTPSSVEVAALCSAMDMVEATYVITLPNADSGEAIIRTALVQAARQKRRVAVEALGSRFYWGLLRAADAMLGNSSSAIIESSALGLPAVNVGDRQKGRLRGENVFDATSDAAAISTALKYALDPATRRACRAMTHPFGTGNSAPLILDALRSWSPSHAVSAASHSRP